MEDFRCPCKKIVCQVEGDTIIIKCRHCKRYVYIYTKGLVGVQYKLKDSPQYLAEASS